MYIAKIHLLKMQRKDVERLAISGFCVSLQSTVQKNGIAMKRVVFFLTFFVMSLVCFGQEEHMTFTGIPIDGTMESFSKILQEKGFRPAFEISDEYRDSSGFYATSLLKGPFYDDPDCGVFIVDDKDLMRVYKIEVFFSPIYFWQSSYKKYKQLQSDLIEKYGKPISAEETIFNNPYATNESRMQDLFEERSVINSTFKTSKGDIFLELSADKESFSLSITYEHYCPVKVD